ncbi:WD40-repeat-containing domain protein [Phlyctochytrium arcticum]|nr:WD40-repeat-containing domain protein [Phlyctochytrium arcticum]
MDDGSDTGDEADQLLPREELLPLIISQLQHYGLNSIAKVVAEASQTPHSLNPSSTLAELCFAGKMAREGGDDGGDIIPANVREDISEDEEEVEDKFEGGKAGGMTGVTKPVPSHTPWFSTQHREACRTAAFSADGKYIATGSADASLKILDVSRIRASHLHNAPEKPVIRTLYDHTGPINDVGFHPNGTVVASCSHDQSIKLFDVQKPNVKRSFRYLQDANIVRSIHFHPSGDYIAAGTDHEAVRIFDVHTLKCFTTPTGIDGHTGAINKIRYSTSGKIFATASEDGSLKTWDTATGTPTSTLPSAHSGTSATSVTFSKSGRYILSCGLDSTGRLWDLRMNRCVQEFKGGVNKEIYTTFTFLGNEDYVLGPDETDWGVLMWDSRTGDLIKRIGAHLAPIRCIVGSPTDSGFVTCSDDYRAKFWSE